MVLIVILYQRNYNLSTPFWWLHSDPGDSNVTTIGKEKHVYELIGGAISLDFVNTRTNYIDKFTPTSDHFDTYTELLNWAQQVSIVTPAQEEELSNIATANPLQAAAALTRAKNLRTAIQRTLAAAGEGRAPEPASFKLFNSELAEAMSHAHIIRSDNGYEWSFQPTPTSLESILWPV